jgi:hypothetical protein
MVFEASDDLGRATDLAATISLQILNRDTQGKRIPYNHFTIRGINSGQKQICICTPDQCGKKRTPWFLKLQVT